MRIRKPSPARWRRSASSLLVIVIAVAALAGCGGDDEEADEPTTTQEQATTLDTPSTLKGDKKQLAEFIRLSYRLAVEDADENGQFTDEGKEILADADVAWQRYLEVVEEPDPSLARVMIQAYGPSGLNQPAEAADAAEILTIAAPSAQAYVQLVQFAAQAGQTRKADLAAEKAIELASPDERDAVRQLLEQAKLTAATQP